ncbi:MAG: RNA polymerase sigma factor [Cellvibrio sp.]
MTLSTDSRNEELISLIARCAIKDQSALKSLFERIGPYLNAVVYRIVKSDDIGKEVLQEAFLQIWSNAQSYRPHLANPLTWMASIARYRALDRLAVEQRLRERFVSSDSDYLLDEHLSHDNPEQDASTSQLKFNLHKCLLALSENIKRSVELAYLYGYSREEIAEKFSTNTNTVKSWLHRGAERLKLCLETNQ